MTQLHCPTCLAGLEGAGADAFTCSGCKARYPVAGGKPILFRHGNTLFDADEYFTKLSAPAPQRSLAGRIADAIVPGPSVNLAQTRMLRTLRQELDTLGQARILVVGIGREEQALEQALVDGSGHQLVGVDVDVESDAAIFCDAHDLPFADGSFDAVVTTAVLEHVCDPQRAVAEIRRVLRPAGLVYSEIPFMQQVHAGPHDFTRYTRSGHIGLFTGFDLVDAGMVAGPGTALVWSIENFIKLMFSRSRFQQLAGMAARMAFFWLKYFDHLFGDKPSWLDGASCTYFYGRKGETRISHAGLIGGYVGSGYRVTYRASLDP